MKLFTCDSCQSPIYYENVACLTCGSALAFLPDTGNVQSISRDSTNGANHYLSKQGSLYKLCANSARYGTCNEAIAANICQDLCRSCLFTEVIPDLTNPTNLAYWKKISIAKRRLLYTLRVLGIMPDPKSINPIGLSFRFMADGIERALTSHNEGVITIALVEADDALREQRRVELGEPYRTLLGHFRHEVGHYYWDRFIRGTPQLATFRDLFGDESPDYTQALQTHYANGPRQDWSAQFISPYASSHPWEDWAETWAHYLHMTDVLETAKATGLEQGAIPSDNLPFPALVEKWLEATHVLNSLGRSMGTGDLYPFVLKDPIVTKMAFIHKTILSVRNA